MFTLYFLHTGRMEDTTASDQRSPTAPVTSKWATDTQKCEHSLIKQTTFYLVFFGWISSYGFLLWSPFYFSSWPLNRSSSGLPRRIQRLPWRAVLGLRWDRLPGETLQVAPLLRRSVVVKYRYVDVKRGLIIERNYFFPPHSWEPLWAELHAQRRKLLLPSPQLRGRRDAVPPRTEGRLRGRSLQGQ